MAWRARYYERSDGFVPGEEFEDFLDASDDRDIRGLLGPLLERIRYAESNGPLPTKRYYSGVSGYEIWQLKARQGSKRGRYFFGWDRETHQLVLLGGVVKERETETPPTAYRDSQEMWDDYKETKRLKSEEG